MNLETTIKKNLIGLHVVNTDQERFWCVFSF